MAREKIFLLGLGLVALLFCARASTAAFSDYSGAWETTDTQSSAYTISWLGDLSSGWSLGIYDIEAGASPGTLTLIDSATTYATFYVDGGNNLRVTQGISSGSTLALASPAGYFGFYFSDGTDNYYTYQYDSSGPANQWLVQMAAAYGAGGPVILSDVNPVPIPGALWLLGSGILGLAVIRRRQKTA